MLNELRTKIDALSDDAKANLMVYTFMKYESSKPQLMLDFIKTMKEAEIEEFMDSTFEFFEQQAKEYLKEIGKQS